MVKVCLRGMKFYAFHGYYDFERRVGCNFVIDVEASLGASGDPKEQIENTINYESIYDICQNFMDKKYKLLETLAFDIANQIKEDHEIVEGVKVILAKLNPPLPGKVDQSEIIIEI